MEKYCPTSYLYKREKTHGPSLEASNNTIVGHSIITFTTTRGECVGIMLMQAIAYRFN